MPKRKEDGKLTRVQQHWTNEELQKLKEIYQRQFRNGEKRLWNRITEVFSREVRPIKRYNLEYKWTYHLAEHKKPAKSISESLELKDQLLMAIPYKGFQELSREEPFTHFTGMNVKNAFYTMVRFIAYTIWFMNAKEKPHEITSMLADRKFLQILAEKGIFLVSMHRNSLELKAVIKRMRPNGELRGDELQVIAGLRAKIQKDLDMIKNLHLSCIGSKSQPLEQDLNEEELAGEERPYEYMFNLSGIPSVFSVPPDQQQKISMKIVSQVYDSYRDFVRPFISNASFSWELKDAQ